MIKFKIYTKISFSEPVKFKNSVRSRMEIVIDCAKPPFPGWPSS